MKGQKALFSSATVEWSTPEGVYKALDDEFHFNFDPCPLGGNKDGTSSLFTSWRERTFCQPCGLNWGIEENRVQWDYGFPNLHKVPCGATSNSEVLSQEPENENRSGLLVSDLCKKTSARNNGNSPRRSDREIEGSEGKKETLLKRTLESKEEAEITSYESQMETTKSRCPIPMDASGLAKVPKVVEQCVCLLRNEDQEVRAGSLCANIGPYVSGYNPIKHASHLSSMQLSQKEQKPLPFLSRPGPPCKNCGLPTSVQPVRAFINCPYDRIGKWLLRAKDAPLTVYLIPARTDVKWFHEIVLPYASEIRFIKGRLKFGESKNPAPFPSMIVVFRK